MVFFGPNNQKVLRPRGLITRGSQGPSFKHPMTMSLVMTGAVSFATTEAITGAMTVIDEPSEHDVAAVDPRLKCKNTPWQIWGTC